MSNNAPDYENNLAFPPQGDWSDTQPKNNTDRTASTIELINKYEQLTKQLEIAIDALKKVESEPYPWYIAGTALEQIKELEK